MAKQYYNLDTLDQHLDTTAHDYYRELTRSRGIRALISTPPSKVRRPYGRPGAKTPKEYLPTAHPLKELRIEYPYLSLYYARKLRRMVENCMLAAHWRSLLPGDADLRFCFELARESFFVLVHLEPTFALIRMRRDEEPFTYRDHTLHVGNVHYLGRAFLRKPSAAQRSRTGFDLLVDRVSKSQTWATICRELLGDNLDKLETDACFAVVDTAWDIAAFCHDVGYLPYMLHEIQTDDHCRHLLSQIREPEGIETDLLKAFNAAQGTINNSGISGIEAFRDELQSMSKTFKAKVDAHTLLHSHASAALILNELAVYLAADSGAAGMQKHNLVALFLALRATFNHETLAPAIDQPRTWEDYPFAAFLAMIDELQDATRLFWRIHLPQSSEVDFAPQESMRIEYFMPIEEVEFNPAESMDYRYRHLPDLEMGQILDRLDGPRKQRLQTALGPKCFGLVKEGFRIRP